MPEKLWCVREAAGRNLWALVHDPGYVAGSRAVARQPLDLLGGTQGV